MQVKHHLTCSISPFESAGLYRAGPLNYFIYLMPLKKTILIPIVILLFSLNCQQSGPAEKSIISFDSTTLGKFASLSFSNDTLVYKIPSYAASTAPLDAPVIWQLVKHPLDTGRQLYITHVPACAADPGMSIKAYPDLYQWAKPPFAWSVFRTSDFGQAAQYWEKDWTGFDRLRIDVYPGNDMRLWLSIEDSVIEPPVTRHFKVKGSKWQTLELDLKQVQKSQNLDIAHMSGLWISANARDSTHVLVGNIRISKRGAPLKYGPVLHPSDDTLPGKREISKPEIRAFKDPVRKKLTLMPPVIHVPLPEFENASFSPAGWVSAFDDNRLLVAFTGREKRTSRKSMWAVQTLDGGKTWKGLGQDAPNGLPVANLDHGTSRGQSIGLQGLSIGISSGKGCAGYGIASPRQRAFLIVPDNASGWRLEKGPFVVDSDIRHCGTSTSFTQLKGGRLWTAWGHIGRHLTMGIHAKYSDDFGATWQGFSRGKTPAVPGSFDKTIAVNSYCFKQVRVFPYKDHAGVVWQDSHGLHVSLYNGKAWFSLPLPQSNIVPVYGEKSMRPPLSAVSLNEHIFLTAAGLNGVFHWNGEQWAHELDSALDGGLLSLSGNTVMLITPGKGQPTIAKKEWVQAEIVYYARSSKGAWSAARKVTDRKVTFLVYRGIRSVSVPAQSPPNFVPVAWHNQSEPGLFIQKVPALSE